MYNITLVCTHHSEIGKCNADELHKIFKSISPDVIFEELPQDLFDRFYKANDIPFDTPEVKAVKRYIKDHITTNVPIDINLCDALSTSEINFMFNSVQKYHVYQQLEQRQFNFMFEKGYDFLNSTRCEELFEEKKSLEKNLIDCQPYRSQLITIHDRFYEEMDIREQEIIKTIFSYSEKTPYNQAILLLGSGHRRSIFEKATNYQSESPVKLNWNVWHSSLP